MNFGSLFTGIGGFDLGFERAGMNCLWQVEIDKKAREVLEHHYSTVERFEDVKSVGKHNLTRPDVLCGGFPCQDLSVAGKRAGLIGERSGLWFEFARIIDELEPRWIVIENVPGLLSSNGGWDFFTIIQWLVKRGYGVCWRILDAQYFGVAQRRRRVFIVGSLGNGRATQVLFESEGMSRDNTSRRETGEDIAGTLANGSNKGRYNATDETFAISGIGEYKEGIGTLRSQGGDIGGGSEMLVPTLHTGMGHHGWSIGDQDWNLLQLQPIIGTLPASGAGLDRPGGQGNELDFVIPTVAWQQNVRDEVRLIGGDGNITGSLSAKPGMKQQTYVGVRRLTPTECARLQGFPDDWNDWLSDSVRYRQFGNAVCVPVAGWIGKRIMKFA